MSISVKVMDYTGRLVRSEIIRLTSGMNKNIIDLSREANGISTLIIFDENNLGVETVKLIKQH